MLSSIFCPVIAKTGKYFLCFISPAMCVSTSSAKTGRVVRSCFSITCTVVRYEKKVIGTRTMTTAESTERAIRRAMFMALNCTLSRINGKAVSHVGVDYIGVHPINFFAATESDNATTTDNAAPRGVPR